MEKLIKLLKNELFITWEDEETEIRLQRIINNAIPTMDYKLGATIDYKIDGPEQNLFLIYCTYVYNNCVKDFDISLTDGFYITEYKHSLLQRSALKSNDILFTTIGHLGSATIVPDNFGEANINQNLVRMKINDATIDPYYLAAFLNSSFVRKQIDCLFTGNIQKILTYPKIKKIKIIKHYM